MTDPTHADPKTPQDVEGISPSNLIPSCLVATSSHPVWWGKFGLESCSARAWRIGPLQLWVQSLTSELRVATLYGDDPMLSEDVEPLPPPDAHPDPIAEVCRFGLQESPRYVTLHPALADRPIVARPEIPLSLPPEQKLAVFISIPLWIRLESDEPPEMLLDIPTFRPSDTWFGPSTVRGELCYASRTQAHVDLKQVVRRPHRAISTVVIHNRAEDLLLLKRIKLPTAQLSLFADANGFLWTQSLILERESSVESDLAFMHLNPGPPIEAGETLRIAQPREPDRGRFVRALQAFLS